MRKAFIDTLIKQARQKHGQNRLEWHYKYPDDRELKLVLKEVS